MKEVIPEDAIIFTDVGWNKNGVAQEFDITLPGTIHHSSGLATMGFGPSAVLGGKLAAPDKIVLNLTGDGGFGINPSCLAAAVEHGIACTWVVMNNAAFGTIAGLENANYKTKFGTVFYDANGERYTPSWADVAKAYGVDSICISSADEFKPALEKAIEANKAGKPFLVEAPMENIVVPTPRLLEHQRHLQSQRAGQGGQAGQEGERPVRRPQPLQVPRRLIGTSCLLPVFNPLYQPKGRSIWGGPSAQFAESLFSEKMFWDRAGEFEGGGSPPRMEIPTPAALAPQGAVSRARAFPPLYGAEKDRDAG